MALTLIARLLGRRVRAGNRLRDAPPHSPEHPHPHQAQSAPAVAAHSALSADAGPGGDDDAALAVDARTLAANSQAAGQDVPHRAALGQEALHRAAPGQEAPLGAGTEHALGQEAPHEGARPEAATPQEGNAGGAPARNGQEAPEGLGPSATLKGTGKRNLPQHRIYHALGNSNQMLGCDRELFLINLLVAAALIFLSHSMVVFAVTTPVALLLFLGLHQMGKRDLLLRHVFIRQLHYQHYYLAQARIGVSPNKRY